MKRAALVIALLSTAPAFAQTMVDGHYRRDGTYVQPHVRSDVNSNRYDNYNAQGNTNPYTGERGTQRHEYTNPPAYNKNFGNPNYGQGSQQRGHRGY